MNERPYHVVAVAVHMALLVGHTIGFVNAIQRRLRFDSTIHGLVAAYEARAVVSHAKELL